MDFKNPEWHPFKWAPTRRGFANNIGTDKPAHQRRLISAFVIPYLEIIISNLGTGEIAVLKLVSAAEETGLSLA